jgi:putative CocE/NonD family hydrolase
LKRGLPFSEYGTVLGDRNDVFGEWVKHPTLDSYWEAKLPSAESFKGADYPVLTITGMYDEHQAGALYYYRTHVQQAPTAARDRHFLVIGPWKTEELWQAPREPEIGGIKLGPGSLTDLKRLQREWIEWTLAGKKKPEFLKGRVAYYVAGADEWRYAESLEAASLKAKTLYLTSKGRSARDVYRAGRLVDEKPKEDAFDEYVYNPLDISGIEVEERERKNWITDAEADLDLRGAGLVYHSDALPQLVDLVGAPTFRAWLDIDVPDTDYRAILYEVLSDGTSVYLGEDLQRARYRLSLKEAQLATPGPKEYTFRFGFMARRIAKGSRFRLVVRAPRSLFLERNYNGGGEVARESRQAARTAHVKLVHGAPHSSALELPILK